MKNSVSLIGRLGSDVEYKQFENGAQASFSLATNEYYKDKDGNKKEITEWHRVIFNGPVAEVCQKYLKKGSLISVEGKLKTRDYDKEGVKHYVTEVRGNELLMLDKKE